MAPKPAKWQLCLAAVGIGLLLTRAQSRNSNTPIKDTAWTIFGLFALFQTVSLIWQAIVWPKFFSPLRHLPQPKGGSLFFGQFWKIYKESNGAPMREWVQTIPNDGLIYYTTVFGAERVLVTSPKALGEVLVSKNYDFIKPSQIRQGIGRVLGIGILLAEGDEHRRQRRLLAPAFAFRHVKNLYPIFWSKARESIEAMGAALATPQHPPSSTDNSGDEKRTGDTDVLEVGQWASRATLDIIGVAGMGQDFGAIQDPSNRLNQIYRRIFSAARNAGIVQLVGLVVPFWLLRRLPLRRNLEITQAVDELRGECRRLIANKRATLEKGGGDSAVDILSVAIESGGFTDEDLVDQLLTFLAAGHETTASSMTWAVYYLCHNLDVQARLRAEVRAKLPSPLDPTGLIDSTRIDALPYLSAVINEVLRIMPPVSITFRVAERSQTLQGHPIPAGTNVILAPWAINTSPQLWGPDAADFSPDRWLRAGQANTGGADSNYSFLTFLHGPRSCIGMAFAKAEFACLLATWVGRYEFSFREGQAEVEIQGGVTARPKGGLSVHVKALEGW